MVATVEVDVVSDVMCPWCFIGKRRLERATDMLPDGISTAVRWRPFQLDSTLPKEGKDRALYLSEKFGSEDRARELYVQVKKAGDGEDIAFDFEAIRVSPNTLDAHRIIRWSTTAGPGVQDRVVELLFQAYFEQGRHIGDDDVLTDIATAAGMDTALVASLLESGADRDEVQREIAVANQMGVTGVPCFIIENRYAVTGAQEPSVLANIISQVGQMKADGTLPDPAG